MNYPPPPSHLSPTAAQWWTSTVEAYVLHDHHLRLLQLACEAWDRAQGARQLLDAEGLTIATAEGGRKAHPAAAIERDNRLACARMIRELDLDLSPPASDRSGPPAIFSNRGFHVRKGSRT